MSNYTNYWRVYRRISKYSSIRGDESKFIQSSLLELEKKEIAMPDYLYDVGCGDGRVSSFFGTIKTFKNIFLFDNSGSVMLAHKRLKSAGFNVTASMIELDQGLKEIKQNSIVLAIGVINFFPDQYKILEKLISNEPKIVFLGVTGFSVGGNIYKGLNIVRGSKAVSSLIGFSLSLVDQKIEHSKKLNPVMRNFFVFFIKLIEPLVASKIYRLKEAEYKTFFSANEYELLKEMELGLCKWFVFVRV